jgi:TPR repeat protein
MYAGGVGVRQNHAIAIKYYGLAADQGVATATCKLGVMYVNGQGVQQDYALAVKNYTLAADQGFANAQYNLGMMYSNGHGVQQNDALAGKLYKLAADQGFPNAQHTHGVMLLQAAQHHSTILSLIKSNAERGDAESQYSLSVMYRDGEGVQQDSVLAVKYCKLAADKGILDAQYSLGLLYQNGHGPSNYGWVVTFGGFTMHLALGTV